MQTEQLYRLTATDLQWDYIAEACFALGMVQIGVPAVILKYIPFEKDCIKDGLDAIHTSFVKQYRNHINGQIKGTSPARYLSDIALDIASDLKSRNEKHVKVRSGISNYPTITLTKQQLDIIATACELLGRLMLGQSDRIGILIPFDDYQLGLEFDEINHRYLQVYRDYVTIERDENGYRKADIPLDIWRKIARKDDFRMGSEPGIEIKQL